MTAAVLSAVPPERSGMAGSTVNTSRELGGVFGVAILGAVLNAQITGSLAHRLKDLGIPANFRSIVIRGVTQGGVPNTAPAGGAAQGHEKLVAQVIHAAQDAFAGGLHTALLIAAAMLLGAALVTVVALRRPQPVAAGSTPSHLRARTRRQKRDPPGHAPA